MPTVYALKNAGCDVINADSLSYLEEAIGISLSCNKIGIPYNLTFTLDENGRLSSTANVSSTHSDDGTQQ